MHLVVHNIYWGRFEELVEKMAGMKVRGGKPSPDNHGFFLFFLLSFPEGIFLDANENGFGSCIPVEGDMHRYPSPHQRELKEKIAKFR